MQEILTVKEAAEILKVHPETVKRWIRNGDMEAFKAGNDWRIRKEVVENMINGEIRG